MGVTNVNTLNSNFSLTSFGGTLIIQLVLKVCQGYKENKIYHIRNTIFLLYEFNIKNI